jgi:hypothetical protein
LTCYVKNGQSIDDREELMFCLGGDHSVIQDVVREGESGRVALLRTSHPFAWSARNKNSSWMMEASF